MQSRPDPSPPFAAYQARAAKPPSSTTSFSLSPELHRDLSRRLASVGLCYSGAYFLAYGSSWVRFSSDMAQHAGLSDVIAGLSIAMGLVVFFTARRGKLPQGSLANVVLVFQVLGGLGIMAGAWHWERELDEFQRRVWQAIGSAEVSFPTGFVERMRAADVRIVYNGGVTWVGVWLLVVPILIPMAPKRTLVAVLLTASTVPGVYCASMLAHGVPESVRPWVLPLFLDYTVPTFICAGLAVFASKAVYRLARDLSRAQQLGSYQLEERIGAGGMGEVWRARHQLLARPAAIKLIRPEMLAGPGPTSPADVLRRFEREAQATARLRSPHTVELYDFGVAQDGTFYYVMELLDGFDLKSLVEKFGPLSPARAVHLLWQACHSLEDAHRSGLVHRDIKPSNIFTCRRGLDHDFVKVLDFGLVKNVDGGKETLELSVEGVTRGTPAFMAPEVATGGVTVDARTDIYSLGCVAYWLVTGSLVFEGPTPVATLLMHVRDEPLSLSKRLGEPIAAPLEALVLDCLRKNPAERPESAAAVASLLAECAAALGPWTPRQAEAWWKQYAPEVVNATA